MGKTPAGSLVARRPSATQLRLPGLDGELVTELNGSGAVHHCKPVKQWLAEHLEQIEVFYLPSYAPELNPDERLNNDLKRAIETKVPMRTKVKLQSTAALHTDELANTPDRIKVFFKDPLVAYAA